MKKANILIVDDDPTTLRLLGNILSGLDREIVMASSGQEALELAKENFLALILLDVQMQGMDGFDTAEALRSREKSRLVPIIFLTAVYKDPSHIFKGYESGAVDYIMKPLDQHILKVKVNVFLDLYKQKRLLENEVMERKRAEEQARAALTVKDKFLSSIAGDLRNPFVKIMGHLKALLDDYACPLSEGHREIIKEAESDGDYILRMIKELLNIGRLKSGIIKPQPRFTDSLTVGIYSISGMEDTAKRKGVKLTCDITEGNRLYADSKLFLEVIENLLSNAIKFSREGDHVSVFVPEDEPTTIAVRDVGVGIPESQRETIFDYEVRISTSGTWGETGTGLGLPLCNDIMKAHGGSLDFESLPGQGSVFYARLPYVKPVILLVDDEPADLILLSKGLEFLGAEFIEAKNGIEALKKMEDTKPHLIIADILMPEMDGFELLVKVRSDPLHGGVPFIVLTNDAKEETWKKAYHLRADEFVPKPIDMDELLPVVRKYV